MAAATRRLMKLNYIIVLIIYQKGENPGNGKPTPSKNG